MKVWLVELWVYNTDDEYGYVRKFYKENRVFDKKEKAYNFLRDFRKAIANQWNVYDVCITGWGAAKDESKITEMELE